MTLPFASVGRIAPAEAHPAARWTIAGLSLVMLMPSLDTSIANAGLPVLARAFGASFQQAQWIVLSYLLATTTLIVSAGRLGDMVGRRRLLLTAIVVFTIASFLCGVASSLWMLLGARTAQGIGAAAMMALAIALVGDAVPAERTGKVMGLLGSMSAIGTALGPSLGGLLMAGLGWQSIFLINVPLGVVAFELVRRHVAGDAPRERPGVDRFDVAGTALLAVTLGAYALAATLTRTSFGIVNAALIVTTVVAGVAFHVVETRTAFPIVRLATLREPVVGRGLALSALVSMVMMTTLVVGPFYLSRVLGLNGMAAGFVLSAGPVVAALTSVPAGRLVDRLGPRRMTMIGLIGIAAGAIGLVVAPPALGVGGYVAPIALMTSGYATFQAANNTAIMASVRGDNRGVVAALLSLSRNLGLITGAAVMATMFANSVAPSDLMTAPPGAVAAGMRLTFAVAAAAIGVAIVAAFRRPSGAAR